MEYKITFTKKDELSNNQEILTFVNDFCDEYSPIEKEIYLLNDERTGAIFTEIHISAEKLLLNSTVDVPLDPDDQEEYRANREIDVKSKDYLTMIDDAKKKRSFSNLVAEYSTDYDSKHPLKIIGGQHRYYAIEQAYQVNVNQFHGIKLYFSLNQTQRMDVQIISNTNIDVSPDLLDRIYETFSGPELRNWCQKVGLLEDNQDFSDKKQYDAPITVRFARTFIINFFEGRKIDPKDFGKFETIPMISQTGVQDQIWAQFKIDNPNLYDDKGLISAGQNFVELDNAQRKYYEDKSGKDTKNAFVTNNYSIESSWAYVSGCLQINDIRLKRHYELKNTSSHDPLNAKQLAKGKHKTDPDNYRGMVTRYGVKERGRMAELFFLQAENGAGIKKGTVELAIANYHAKIANIEAQKLKEKLQK